ncbi:MAG: hypothetical protein KAS39_01415, partial [Actinomycetia bacterium]|nr:hypothetical protein [Actinomycetes bacterium]
MPITTGLHLRQQQKLVMTPQLHQAIALLQLSTIELAQKIEEELVKNPVLEEVLPGENEDKDESEKDSEDSSSLETDVENLTSGTVDKDNLDQDEWLDKFEDSSDIGYQYTEKSSDNKQKFIEQTPEALPSLSEHLQWQLRLTLSDDVVFKLGELLISFINEDGYFTIPIEQFAEEYGISDELAVDLLHLIQNFEPYGVGARNLRECLLLQLPHQKLISPWVEPIV